MQDSAKVKQRPASSVLAITTISHMMQHIFVGTSVLFPLVMAELRLNYAEFGLAVAIASLIGGMFQLVFSVTSRRIARHVLLGLGNILLSVGTFLMGLAQDTISFLSTRMVANIGVAPQHSMGTAIISEKFERRQIGKAMGIHYGLAYIGNIIGPMFMTFSAIAIGWRNTLFVFALPTVIVGSIVILYLNRDKDMTHRQQNKGSSSLRTDIISLMKTRSIVAIISTQILISGGADLGIITTYTPLFLANGLKLETFDSGIFYTVGLVGGVMGPLLLGRYADRIGYIKTAIVATSIGSILIYLLSLYDSASPLLVAHLFLLGFASFALPTLLQSHLANLTREYKRDLVVGIFFTANFLAGSLWTGVMGYIIYAYSSFKPAFILMGTLGIAALVLMISQMRRSEG